MRLIAFVLPITWMLAFLSPVQAQAAVKVTDTQVEYEFGKSITFRAHFESDQPIDQVVVLFGSTNGSYTESTSTRIQPNGEAVFVYDLTDNSLMAFSHIKYRFRATLSNGEVFTSDYFNFYYEDNRHIWQTLEDKPFVVHWYSGDVDFAQRVLNVAQEGLHQAQIWMPINSPAETLNIYLYASAADMQATLGPASENWVAGHADPRLGVMVVTLPSGPEQRLLIEQRIPHELMHILLYQLSGAAYNNLPTWLNEGLASTAELYPNPDYQLLLDNAYQKESLLPIASLCETFPRDASNALLAYAEAASFTEFLHDYYGKSGMEALIANYANGLDCSRGVEVALGENLTQVERRWRAVTFAENASLTAMGNLLPWLALMAAVLVAPIVLSLARPRRRSLRHTIY